MIRKRTISCNDDRGNECILAAGAVGLYYFTFVLAIYFVRTFYVNGFKIAI